VVPAIFGSEKLERATSLELATYSLGSCFEQYFSALLGIHQISQIIDHHAIVAKGRGLTVCHIYSLFLPKGAPKGPQEIDQ
jgi:hypothetical protein